MGWSIGPGLADHTPLPAAIRWLNLTFKKLEGAFNAHGHYGATDVHPTGNDADATARIQRALDFAAGGGTVILAPGDYVITGRLKIYDTSRVTVLGYGARLLVRDGADARPFVVRNSTDIEVHGLTLKDETTSGFHNGLDIQDSSRVRVERCRFYDFDFYGCTVCQDTDGNPAGPWGPVQACNDITLSHCYFENCRTYGAEFFPKYVSYRQHVVDCTFVDCGRLGSAGNSGAAIKVGSLVWGAVVSRNIVTGGNIGLATGAQHAQTITDNWFIDCNQFGIAFSIGPWSGGGGITFEREECVIARNSFVFTPGFAPTDDTSVATLAPAVEINGAGDVLGTLLIENNLIERWSLGVRVLMTGAVTITGGGLQIRRNRIVDTVGAMIYVFDSLGATIDDVVIEDNSLANTDAAATGAKLIAYGARMRVVRNTLVGLSGGAILVNGDGAEVAENRLIDLNPAGTASQAAIVIADTAANTYRVHDNHVEGGTLAALIDVSGASPTINVWGNFSVTPIPLRRTSSVTLAFPKGNRVTVRECGAKGDGSTNDATAINAAAQLAGADGTVVFESGKTYRVTATVGTTYDDQTWEMYGATILVDFAGVGVQVGTDAATRVRRVAILGGSITRNGTLTWTSGDVGIRFVNANFCRYDLTGEIYGFNVGLELLGSNAQGQAYQTVNLSGRIVSCKTGVRMYAKSGGWCNANKLFGGGSIAYASTDPDATGGYGVSLDKDTAGTPGLVLNENVVFGLSIESAKAALKPSGALYVNGQENSFIGCRYEGFTNPFIIAGPDWQNGGNKFIGATGLTDPATDVDTSGATGSGAAEDKYTYEGRNGNHKGGGSSAHPLQRWTETNASSNVALQLVDVNDTAVFEVGSDGELKCRGFAPRYSSLTVANSPWTPTVAHYAHGISATGGAVTVNLPSAAAADMIGHVFVLEKTDSSTNAVTINRAGSDTIMGLTALTLAEQYAAVALQSDGVSTWRVLWRNRVPTSLTSNYAGGGTTVLAEPYDFHILNMTGGAAFTFTISAAPTNGTRMRYVVRNSSGGALGAATIGANLRTVGYANPAAGLQVHADLVYDSGLAKWVGEWSAAY